MKFHVKQFGVSVGTIDTHGVLHTQSTTLRKLWSSWLTVGFPQRNGDREGSRQIERVTFVAVDGHVKDAVLTLRDYGFIVSEQP